MRWTRQRRRARRSQGGFSRERTAGVQTNGADADGKSVWFRHPLLVSSCRWRMRSNRIVSPQVGSDGDKTEFVAEEITP
jgi:hypothetical protein